MREISNMFGLDDYEFTKFLNVQIDVFTVSFLLPFITVTSHFSSVLLLMFWLPVAGYIVGSVTTVPKVARSRMYYSPFFQSMGASCRAAFLHKAVVVGAVLSGSYVVLISWFC